MKNLWKNPWVKTTTVLLAILVSVLTVIKNFFQNDSVANKNTQTMTNSPNATQNQYNGPVTIQENLPKIVFQNVISIDEPTGGYFKQTFRVVTTQSDKSFTFKLLTPIIPIQNFVANKKGLSIASGTGVVPDGTYQEYELSFLTKKEIGNQVVSFGLVNL